MSEAVHLLIDGIVPGWEPPARLARLTATLAPAAPVAVDDDCPATPHEVALAAALGWDAAPGRWPWAARAAGVAGQPCAFALPCHWQVAADHALLLPPQALGLDTAERALLADSLAPYLAEDGIALQPAPDDGPAWLAIGQAFAGARTVSPSRAMGRRLTPAQLASGAPVLRRLAAELQMLLHAHPLNEARAARGALPVNALWFWGAGTLPAPAGPEAAAQVLEASAGDTARVAEQAQQLAQARARGAAVRLTLSGARASQTLGPAGAGLARRVSGLFGLRGNIRLLEQL